VGFYENGNKPRARFIKDGGCHSGDVRIHPNGRQFSVISYGVVVSDKRKISVWEYELAYCRGEYSLRV
jgi:hypothetical protein